MQTEERVLSKHSIQEKQIGFWGKEVSMSKVQLGIIYFLGIGFHCTFVLYSTHLRMQKVYQKIMTGCGVT